MSLVYNKFKIKATFRIRLFGCHVSLVYICIELIPRKKFAFDKPIFFRLFEKSFALSV